MVRTAFVFLALVSFLFAGGPAGAADPIVVRNSSHGAWEATSGKRIHLDEELVLGSVDGEDAFGRVSGVAVDSRGRWIILDGGFGIVRIYHPDSLTLTDFGSKGEGPGEFLQPSAIAVDSQDRIFVASQGRISLFSPYGAFIESFKPERLVVTFSMGASQRGVYFVSFDAPSERMVHCYNPKHEWVASFSNAWSTEMKIEPSRQLMLCSGAIDIDTKGNVWYTDFFRYQLRKFSPTGDLLMTVTRENDHVKQPVYEPIPNGERVSAPGGMMRLLALPDGRVLTASFKYLDSEAKKARTFVDLFDADGKLLTTWTRDELLRVQCVDAKGRLYAVVDRECPQVVKLEMVEK